MLELAVLGLLKEKPMSGYELQKQLTAKFGAFWRVSFGSLYPCLKRLESEGALDASEPSASRRKRLYRLTDRGELLFFELLESADVHDLEQDKFTLRLAFFSYLRPETRVEQLEQRRGYLQRWVADVRTSLRTARERMDAYTISLMDHGLDEREREIAWLDRLIAAERDGAERPPRRARKERHPTATTIPGEVATAPARPTLSPQTSAPTVAPHDVRATTEAAGLPPEAATPVVAPAPAPAR